MPVAPRPDVGAHGTASLHARLLEVAVPLLACVLLAGCTLKPAVGDGAVAIHGEGPHAGTQRREAECGGVAGLGLDVEGSAGQIIVTVTDGQGARAFHDSIPASGPHIHTETLQGRPGTWRLDVATSADFAGRYEATLSCQD